MDNLCHTLVGAAFGEAGLKRRTAYGNATLMIASNLPDVDVLVFATDAPSIAFRRGWTHGILAQALLPVVLTAIVVLLSRWRRRSVQPESRRAGAPALDVRWTLALAYLGVVLHVLLDLLNNYGVRLLTPVSWQWFYGDSVFIIDPWLWITLALGIWFARRRQRVRAPRYALAVAAMYIALMVLSARVARTIVVDHWRAQYGRDPVRVMVGPEPVTPRRRVVIVDAGDHYESGTFTWWPRTVTFDPMKVPKNDDRPEVADARGDRFVGAFLVWSRFPFWTLKPEGTGTRVTVADMRFMAAGRRFFATTVVPDRSSSR
jgi:inner membrane protein